MREYFRRYSRAEREKVKVFVCDMWKDYRDISLLFPNAVLVTDKYHWVRQVIWAVEKVRKRVQKQFPKNKRLHFKRNKYILLAYQEKLEVEDGLVLKYMLNQNTDLYHAWQLKEMFYAFKDSTTYAEAAKRLKEFLLAAEQTEIYVRLMTRTDRQSYLVNAYPLEVREMNRQDMEWLHGDCLVYRFCSDKEVRAPFAWQQTQLPEAMPTISVMRDALLLYRVSLRRWKACMPSAALDELIAYADRLFFASAMAAKKNPYDKSLPSLWREDIVGAEEKFLENE